MEGSVVLCSQLKAAISEASNNIGTGSGSGRLFYVRAHLGTDSISKSLGTTTTVEFTYVQFQ